MRPPPRVRPCPRPQRARPAAGPSWGPPAELRGGKGCPALRRAPRTLPCRSWGPSTASHNLGINRHSFPALHKEGHSSSKVYRYTGSIEGPCCPGQGDTDQSHFQSNRNHSMLCRRIHSARPNNCISKNNLLWSFFVYVQNIYSEP